MSGQTSNDEPVFSLPCSYQNAKAFRGFRRLYVTVYNDYDQSEANAMALLQDDEVYNCIGHTITLWNIDGFNYSGVGVYVDDFPFGTIWDRGDSDPVFAAAYNREFTEAYLRIERSNPHPKVYLFINANL